MNTPYVPIEELAKHLSVSVSTIRGWVRNKHIPENTYIRVINTYRFSVNDVVDALSATKNHPQPVVRAEPDFGEDTDEPDVDV
jgi:excisionase family DNA binding protein